MAGAEGRVEIRRTIAAPRERIFEAWTEAEALSRWLAPGDAEVTAARADARPGGAWSVDMRAAAGEWSVAGEFVELDAPERVVLTWRWAHEPADAVSRVTVELRDVPGGTELTLVHDGLSEDSRDGHRDGWESCLPKLDAAVTEGVRR